MTVHIKAQHVTMEQSATLANCRHLIHIADLGDGDILCLDKSDVSGDHVFRGTSHYGPYVLTFDGKVQDVNYHYARYHNLEIPF